MACKPWTAGRDCNGQNRLQINNRVYLKDIKNKTVTAFLSFVLIQSTDTNHEISKLLLLQHMSVTPTLLKLK